MRLQIASDLHLESLLPDFPGERLIAPAHGAEVLVLAGDIANGTKAVQLFSDWPVPVLYVAGNHEHYGHDTHQLRQELRAATVGTAVQFLDNDMVDFGGVRFVGAPLWTDCRLTLNLVQRELMEIAARRINDHRHIRIGARAFTPQDALEAHATTRRWLSGVLESPYDGRTVVITHHAPHPLSVHPRYAGDPLNAAFVSDVTALLPRVDLWIHGHVHDSFDYCVGNCRVVANPRGYACNRSSSNLAHKLHYENPEFKWACVIDLPPG